MYQYKAYIFTEFYSSAHRVYAINAARKLNCSLQATGKEDKLMQLWWESLHFCDVQLNNSDIKKSYTRFWQMNLMKLKICRLLYYRMK